MQDLRKFDAALHGIKYNVPENKTLPKQDKKMDKMDKMAEDMLGRIKSHGR